MIAFLAPPHAARNHSCSGRSRPSCSCMFFVAPTHVAQLIAGRQATPQTVALVSPAPRPRPADPHAVPRLPLAPAARRPRLLVLQLDARHDAALAARLPVTASLALGAAVLWLVIGISLGRAGVHPAPLAGRPGGHRLGAVLLLDADLPARAHPAVLPLLPADAGGVRHLPGQRLRAAFARIRSRGCSTSSCPGCRSRS